MAFNLLDTVRSYITPDLIEKASAHLGEPSSGISKAVSAAVPALLAMFVNRAESGNAQGLLRDAHNAADSNVLNNPQDLVSGSTSILSGGMDDAVSGMFGGHSSGILSSIANFAGIKSGSVQGLLGLLAPLGLGALGRHARESNLSADGLTSYLSSQKASIMSALPAGLSAGNLFADKTTTTHSTTNTGDAHHHTTHVDTVHEEHKTNWVPWLLLGLGVVALLWFLGRGCNDDTESTTIVADTTAVVSAAPMDTATNAAQYNSGTREATKVRLADGTELNAYKGGVEDQLVACLNNASCAAGKDQWYDFDNINFETGSARLTTESQDQVQNIAAILKAYPNAKIKIGGYTDKTGNDAANKTLSQQRADAVMAAIKSAGGTADQLVGAEGYGSEFAKVAATASDEERRQDRRIAVQLREK